MASRDATNVVLELEEAHRAARERLAAARLEVDSLSASLNNGNPPIPHGRGPGPVREQELESGERKLAAWEAYEAYVARQVSEARRTYDSIREHRLLPERLRDAKLVAERTSSIEAILRDVLHRGIGLRRVLQSDLGEGDQLHREATGEPSGAEHDAGRVLFVTALGLEAAAVRSHVEGGMDRTVDRYGTVRHDGAHVAGSGRSWSVRVVSTGEKNERAAAVTALVAEEYQPDYVFFVGVAGSIKNIGAKGVDVQLGDVVSSSLIYPMTGKLIDAGTQIRPHAVPTSYALDQAVISLHADEALYPSEVEPWSARLRDRFWDGGGMRRPAAFHKPIVATDFVIGTRRHPLFKELVEAYPDAYAVEMEGFGFLTAMWVLNYRGLVVRGLSDNLAGKTSSEDERWQPIAARSAAAMAFTLLDRV